MAQFLPLAVLVTLSSVILLRLLKLVSLLPLVFVREHLIEERINARTGTPHILCKQSRTAYRLKPDVEFSSSAGTRPPVHALRYVNRVYQLVCASDFVYSVATLSLMDMIVLRLNLSTQIVQLGNFYTIGEE